MPKPGPRTTYRYSPDDEITVTANKVHSGNRKFDVFVCLGENTPKGWNRNSCSQLNLEKISLDPGESRKLVNIKAQITIEGSTPLNERWLLIETRRRKNDRFVYTTYAHSEVEIFEAN